MIDPYFLKNLVQVGLKGFYKWQSAKQLYFGVIQRIQASISESKPALLAMPVRPSGVSGICYSSSESSELSKLDSLCR